MYPKFTDKSISFKDVILAANRSASNVAVYTFAVLESQSIGKALSPLHPLSISVTSLVLSVLGIMQDDIYPFPARKLGPKLLIIGA